MANPYDAYAGLRNPYTGFDWQQPTGEFDRSYYNTNPGQAVSPWARAGGGSLGGSLEKFLRSLQGDLFADYVTRNQAEIAQGKPGLAFTDTLTPDRARQAWAQWQGQNPYARGENPNLFAGAGRRV
jgi:hypothetical protein